MIKSSYVTETNLGIRGALITLLSSPVLKSSRIIKAAWVAVQRHYAGFPTVYYSAMLSYRAGQSTIQHGTHQIAQDISNARFRQVSGRLRDRLRKVIERSSFKTVLFSSISGQDGRVGPLIGSRLTPGLLIWEQVPFANIQSARDTRAFLSLGIS